MSVLCMKMSVLHICCIPLLCNRATMVRFMVLMVFLMILSMRKNSNENESDGEQDHQDDDEDDEIHQVESMDDDEGEYQYLETLVKMIHP